MQLNFYRQILGGLQMEVGAELRRRAPALRRRCPDYVKVKTRPGLCQLAYQLVICAKHIIGRSGEIVPLEGPCSRRL